MATPNADSEQIRYDILIEAKQAIQNLRGVMKATEDNTTKMQLFSVLVVDSAKKWGMAWQQALAIYKQLNAELSKSKKGTLFGQTGGKDLMGQTEKYLQTLDDAGRLQTTVAKSADKMGDSVENATRRGTRGIDAMRIALGVLVSMLIFQVMQAVQNVFRQMVHNVREAELAVLNLINAERRLSEQGVDITPKGLQEIIDKVQELIPILSKVDAEELVSRIATNLAPALHLTGKEIEKIALITGSLYVKNKALGYSYDEIEKAVNDAFLTGKVSQGLNKFGVKINDQIVLDEALRLGLVKTKEEFNSLTGEMEAHVKTQAMINILWKDTQNNLQAIPEYMQTFDSQIERTKSAWSDLLTAFGNAGYATALAEVFSFIAGILESWIEIIEFLKPAMVGFLATAIAGWTALGYKITHPLSSLKEFMKVFNETQTQTIKDMMKGLEDAVDTPTGTPEINIETDDAIQSLEELENKIEDIIADTANAREDLAENLNRKLEDLDTEYLRKAEDAHRDYLRKVEDINRDYEDDLADLRREHREEDEKDEAKYQLALWELRQRFLMNLEDALHARDARQIIRLQKQYAIDKEALRRKHELESAEREQSQRDELADAEQRRQERLADARIEYEQKLADLNLAKQREAQDLQKWYEREQQDLELAMQRKLETLIKGWIDEKKITEANAAEVYGILSKYFGPGGMTDALYQYMMDSLIASTQGAISAAAASMTGMLGGGVGGGGHTVPLSTGNGGTGATTGRGRAEGGSLLATRPTRELFGEAGPELVTFTPINRIGRNEGKLDVSGAAGIGMDGKVRVLIDLSPGLEGRIIEKSMDGVGQVLAQINRSKV